MLALHKDLPSFSNKSTVPVISLYCKLDKLFDLYVPVNKLDNKHVYFLSNMVLRISVYIFTFRKIKYHEISCFLFTQIFTLAKENLLHENKS